MKRYLLSEVEFLRIHRSTQMICSLAMRSYPRRSSGFASAVRPPKTHAVEFTYGGTLAKPTLTRVVPSKAGAANRNKEVEQISGPPGVRADECTVQSWRIFLVSNVA